MSDTGYSMPMIQKHAMRWSEGAVPELQKIAKESPWLTNVLRSAVRGKTRSGTVKRDAWTIYCASTQICGDLPAKTLSLICAGIRI